MSWLQQEGRAGIPPGCGWGVLREFVVNRAEASGDCKPDVEMLQCASIAANRRGRRSLEHLRELDADEVGGVEAQRVAAGEAALDDAAILQGEISNTRTVGVGIGIVVPCSAAPAFDAGLGLAVEAPSRSAPAGFDAAESEGFVPGFEGVGFEKLAALPKFAIQGQAGREVAGISEGRRGLRQIVIPGKLIVRDVLVAPGLAGDADGDFVVGIRLRCDERCGAGGDCGDGELERPIADFPNVIG